MKISPLFSFLLPAVAIAEAPAWPDFRGPHQNGTVPQEYAIPLRWSETDHIAWKTPLPGRAWSTPVITGNNVWMTDATKDGSALSAICLSLADGKVLHRRILFRPTEIEELGNPLNCYGSPSPVLNADGTRVFLHFGTYGTACLDSATGETIWSRADIHCRHYRGPGSSPVLHGNHLILTMDGIDVQFTIALDASTGKTVWRTDRTTQWDDLDENGEPKAHGDYRKAFSTPILATIKGKQQLVSCGAYAAFGYDPNSGKELWTLPYKGYSNASRPLSSATHLYINSGFETTELIALPLDPAPSGKLNAEESASFILDKRMPQKTSPLLFEDRLLITVNDAGIIICSDAKTGAEFWSERHKGKFSASPILFGNTVIAPSAHGPTYLVRASEDYLLIGINTLEDGMMASPAPAPGRLVLRTKTAVYCVRESAP